MTGFAKERQDEKQSNYLSMNTHTCIVVHVYALKIMNKTNKTCFWKFPLHDHISGLFIHKRVQQFLGPLVPTFQGHQFFIVYLFHTFIEWTLVISIVYSPLVSLSHCNTSFQQIFLILLCLPLCVIHWAHQHVILSGQYFMLWCHH